MALYFISLTVRLYSRMLTSLRFSSNLNSLSNSSPSAYSQCYPAITFGDCSRAIVSKCKLIYLTLVSCSKFWKAGCSGYLKHARSQLAKPCSFSSCAESLRKFHFLELLCMRILEQVLFWSLHFTHVCGLADMLLSTGPVSNKHRGNK